MNPRIELVENDEIRWRPYAGQGVNRSIAVFLTCDGLVFEDNPGTVDYEGLRALLDVANCKLATGSFAALADTSDVPFPGKRMRCADYMEGNCECTVLYPRDGGWAALLPSSSIVSPAKLLPLIAPTPPEPKVRPYTPEQMMQASVNLTRRVRKKSCSYEEAVVSIGRKSAELFACIGEGLPPTEQVDFSCLLDSYTWADNNSPCGVIEHSPKGATR